MTKSGFTCLSFGDDSIIIYIYIYIHLCLLPFTYVIMYNLETNDLLQLIFPHRSMCIFVCFNVFMSSDLNTYGTVQQ